MGRKEEDIYVYKAHDAEKEKNQEKESEEPENGSLSMSEQPVSYGTIFKESDRPTPKYSSESIFKDSAIPNSSENRKSPNNNHNGSNHVVWGIAVFIVFLLVIFALASGSGKKSESTPVYATVTQELTTQTTTGPETTTQAKKETTLAETPAARETSTTRAETSPAVTEESLILVEETTPETLMAEPEPDSEFILPDSDRRYLSRSDIEGLSADQLRIARNELYARHGRLFADPALQAYFDACSWYYGYIPAEQFSDELTFNQYEIANRDLIKEYEQEMGYIAGCEPPSLMVL